MKASFLWLLYLVILSVASASCGGGTNWCETDEDCESRGGPCTLCIYSHNAGRSLCASRQACGDQCSAFGCSRPNVTTAKCACEFNRTGHGLPTCVPGRAKCGEQCSSDLPCGNFDCGSTTVCAEGTCQRQAACNSGYCATNEVCPPSCPMCVDGSCQASISPPGNCGTSCSDGQSCGKGCVCANGITCSPSGEEAASSSDAPSFSLSQFLGGTLLYPSSLSSWGWKAQWSPFSSSPLTQGEWRSYTLVPNPDTGPGDMIGDSLCFGVDSPWHGPGGPECPVQLTVFFWNNPGPKKLHGITIAFGLNYTQWGCNWSEENLSMIMCNITDGINCGPCPQIPPPRKKDAISIG